MLQQQNVKRAREFRERKGLPIKWNEAFPKASTLSQCQEWVKQTHLETNTKESLLSHIFINFTYDVTKSLATGKSLDAVIAKADLMAKPEWKKVIAYNQAGIEAMKKCPYLEWFNPSDYDELNDSSSLGEGGILNISYWAQGMETQAIVLAKNGQVEEAKALLYTIHESTDINCVSPARNLSPHS